MGPNIYFPPARPTLKLVRASTESRVAIKPTATPAEPAASSAAHVAEPARTSEPSVEDAWRKLHRAHELFAAEQAHLRDERRELEARMAAVSQRELAVALREAQVAERERNLATIIAASTPSLASSEPAEPSVSRFSRAPMDIARSLLGGKKSA